jgi:hypothetical protein
MAAWRLWCPRRDLNFPDMQSLEEAEFLALLHISSLRRIVAAITHSSDSSSSPSAMRA